MLLLFLKSALFLVIQFDVNPGLAQSCLQSAEGGPILFEKGLDLGFPSNSQVIVTSYQFQCCGNIVEWQTAVRRDGSYTIHFQVWRPSPTVESDGCYSLVGENRFISITLDDDILVTVTPQPTNIISVQPGDVLGYYSINDINRNRRRGIALHEDLRSETVWYHTNIDPQTVEAVGGSCPFPVGAGPERTLNSSTNKGPVISASLVTFNCTSQSSATTIPSLLPTYTSHILASSASPLPTHYLTMTTHPNATGIYKSHGSASSASPRPTHYFIMTPHMTTPPKAAGMSVRNNTGIIAGVCVSAVLVVTLGILAAAIAIHRRKAIKGKRALSESDSRKNTEMKDNPASMNNPEVTSSDQHYETVTHFHQQNEEELTQNAAYISTPGIAVEANECYGSTTAPAPADQDDLYISI